MLTFNQYVQQLHGSSVSRRLMCEKKRKTPLPCKLFMCVILSIWIFFDFKEILYNSPAVFVESVKAKSSTASVNSG